MPTGHRIFAVLVAAGIAVAGCGGGDDRPTLERDTAPTSPTTSTTLPANTSQIARVVGTKIDIFDIPGASTPSRTLPNPWPLDDDPTHVVPQVFLVQHREGDWIQVLLPVRPNGTSGWVRASDVTLVPVSYRIVVALGAHHITVYDGDRVVLEGPVAVGAPATPTPTGTYYLRVLLQAPDPNTVYGPYAYGLSGHSDVLTEFNGGDGELGIHGNNDASVLGSSVTHGCIRMPNDGITLLSSILPLGTPVQILP